MASRTQSVSGRFNSLERISFLQTQTEHQPAHLNCGAVLRERAPAHDLAVHHHKGAAHGTTFMPSASMLRMQCVPLRDGLPMRTSQLCERPTVVSPSTA